MIVVRPVRAADRSAVNHVESLSTPGLRYLDDVFDMFSQDARGEFMLAELNGEVVGVAKFTVFPDGTGWLEALRVPPDMQGKGIGKRLYERFLEIAETEGIQTLRMYTGLANAVSRGLAERFGFSLEETFLGYSCSARPDEQCPPAFTAVSDPRQAVELLMPLCAGWGDFIVMNRSFYRFTPELCAHFARRGEVYQAGDSVLVLGARFSPGKAQHVGLFSGDADACLRFAMHKAAGVGARHVHCLFPLDQAATRMALEARAFEADKAPYIVMRRTD